jgi:hypothetical protein
MITERHNLAWRMIFKAISKAGSLGSCIVSMDIGSNKRMTMQNLQIPETAENRLVPKWLFPLRFSDKDRFTSSLPDFVLVTPIAAKTQKQQTDVGGVGSSEWQGAIERDWEHLISSTASHQ